MAHVRTQLRDAVISAIASDVAAFNGRVDKVRGFGRNVDILPACEVSTPNEQVVGVSTDGMLERNVELLITCMVAGRDTVEDDCDALAVGIEQAVYGSNTVMGMIKEIAPESTSFDIQGEGEKRIAQMQMSWSCVIVTLEAEPETAI